MQGVEIVLFYDDRLLEKKLYKIFIWLYLCVIENWNIVRSIKRNYWYLIIEVESMDIVMELYIYVWYVIMGWCLRL